MVNMEQSFSHLDRLEAQSITIMREVIANFDNPVMLYSIGKDSAVMLHLAMLAFAPGILPFPLLHIDTGWKFKEMIAFRDKIADEMGIELLVYTNPDGAKQCIGPITHGSKIHTDMMKTQALKQALDKYGFDAAFGGARRDEEKSRAKERILSFRSKTHQWEPQKQRPEPFGLFNTQLAKGESVRAFPLSNWTERDIWHYILRENIPLPSLYLAKERKVIKRDGMLIMVDDERLDVKPDERVMNKKVRFRTLGCYPLTAAMESEAETVGQVIAEIIADTSSERQGRLIDNDQIGSMEKKKHDGYF
ncbi:MAG: sulfate adenylyltransferase subunit CysD [Alphaproteobacteria bacterium]|nr:sulfate adenylyltransferase subunit CysD [Alphaproteobacteria bacterium]